MQPDIKSAATVSSTNRVATAVRSFPLALFVISVPSPGPELMRLRPLRCLLGRQVHTVQRRDIQIATQLSDFIGVDIPDDVDERRLIALDRHHKQPDNLLALRLDTNLR